MLRRSRAQRHTRQHQRGHSGVRDAHLEWSWRTLEAVHPAVCPQHLRGDDVALYNISIRIESFRRSRVILHDSLLRREALPSKALLHIAEALHRRLERGGAEA